MGIWVAIQSGLDHWHQLINGKGQTQQRGMAERTADFSTGKRIAAFSCCRQEGSGGKVFHVVPVVVETEPDQQIGINGRQVFRRQADIKLAALFSRQRIRPFWMATQIPIPSR